MRALLLATLLGLLLLWWRTSLEARAIANAAASAACAEAGVQLLDGTVAFARLSLGRSARGERALRRSYVFDYTEDGAGRRHGCVVLCGHEVERIGLGPLRTAGRDAGTA